MANASITKLVSGRSGISLVSVNEHGHFDGPHRGAADLPIGEHDGPPEDLTAGVATAGAAEVDAGRRCRR